MYDRDSYFCIFTGGTSNGIQLHPRFAAWNWLAVHRVCVCCSRTDHFIWYCYWKTHVLNELPCPVGCYTLLTHFVSVAGRWSARYTYLVTPTLKPTLCWSSQYQRQYRWCMATVIIILQWQCVWMVIIAWRMPGNGNGLVAELEVHRVGNFTGSRYPTIAIGLNPANCQIRVFLSSKVICTCSVFW